MLRAELRFTVIAAGCNLSFLSQFLHPSVSQQAASDSHWLSAAMLDREAGSSARAASLSVHNLSLVSGPGRVSGRGWAEYQQSVTSPLVRCEA